MESERNEYIVKYTRNRILYSAVFLLLLSIGFAFLIVFLWGDLTTIEVALLVTFSLFMLACSLFFFSLNRRPWFIKMDRKGFYYWQGLSKRMISWAAISNVNFTYNSGDDICLILHIHDAYQSKYAKGNRLKSFFGYDGIWINLSLASADVYDIAEKMDEFDPNSDKPVSPKEEKKAIASQNRRSNISKIIFALGILFLVVGCTSNAFISDDDYLMLGSVTIALTYFILILIVVIVILICLCAEKLVRNELLRYISINIILTAMCGTAMYSIKAFLESSSSYILLQRLVYEIYVIVGIAPFSGTESFFCLESFILFLPAIAATVLGYRWLSDYQFSKNPAIGILCFSLIPIFTGILLMCLSIAVWIHYFFI